MIAGSPCIDVGNNSAVPAEVLTDLDGNTRIVNNVVDLGTYEFVGSPLPLCTPEIKGDINCDGVVNLIDLSLLALNWLNQVGS